MFGITHEEPANPLNEHFFAHAVADSLFQLPWIKNSIALTVDKEEPWNETHIWAPDIIFHNGLYYIYYCDGGNDNSKHKIHLATSKNLKEWTRHPSNPMVVDGYDARDPHVFYYKNKWLMYYTATRPSSNGNHVVVVVESDDLINWHNKQVVFTHPNIGTYGGATESPFVVVRNDKFYLFVCTNNPYDNTVVYERKIPFHWDIENNVGEFSAHCSEVIKIDNDWYISRAGWGKGGLFLAKLRWID